MNAHTKKDRYNATLNDEEKDLLESFERGEWKSVENIAEEKAFAKKVAANYLHADAHVDVKLASSDFARLKQKAVFEGIPYQILIASILHKYASGHL